MASAEPLQQTGSAAKPTLTEGSAAEPTLTEGSAAKPVASAEGPSLKKTNLMDTIGLTQDVDGASMADASTTVPEDDEGYDSKDDFGGTSSGR